MLPKLQKVGKHRHRHEQDIWVSFLYDIIVYVWSQYDGGNIEQRTIGYGSRQNQEANLKIVGGVIPQSNQQEADPISSYKTSVIVS